MNPVAKTIAAIRAQHSLTQQQLADMAGVPRATLANMESNGGNPTITTVIKIANALGVTVSDLVEKNQLTVATLVARQDMQSIRLDDGKFVSSQLSPINAPYILINEISMLPGCHSKGRPHPQGSHEFFYCLWARLVQFLRVGHPLTVTHGLELTRSEQVEFREILLCFTDLSDLGMGPGSDPEAHTGHGHGNKKRERESRPYEALGAHATSLQDHHLAVQIQAAVAEHDAKEERYRQDDLQQIR